MAHFTKLGLVNQMIVCMITDAADILSKNLQM